MIKNNFGKKIFFWAAVAAEQVQGGLAHGEKGRMTNGGEKVFQRCFYHTYRVFCAVKTRPPRPATTTATTAAATAT